MSESEHAIQFLYFVWINKNPCTIIYRCIGKNFLTGVGILVACTIKDSFSKLYGMEFGKYKKDLAGKF